MGEVDKNIEKIAVLITEGNAVLNSKPDYGEYGYLNHNLFHGWKAQSLTCLTTLFGAGNAYPSHFEKVVITHTNSSVGAGVDILKRVHSDLLNGFVESPQLLSPLLLIEQICARFHRMARQLRQRHNKGATLDVQNEYDVQDLLHALLHLHFEDIREEEPTPSLAGSSARVDFLLKRERIVIEVKHTRKGLDAKELKNQLAEDILHYAAHQDCKTLVCFVYDPQGIITNPHGVEDDLSREDGQFPVKVFRRPHH